MSEADGAAGAGAAAALCATYNTTADPEDEDDDEADNEEDEGDELVLLKLGQFFALTLLVLAVGTTHDTRPPMNTFSLAIVALAYMHKLTKV